MFGAVSPGAALGPGDLDPTFGSDGIVRTNFRYDLSNTGFGGQTAIEQADGKLVVAGYGDNSENDDFALARFNIDGGLDTSFGDGGRVTTGLGPADDWAFALVQQADGKLVAAGYTETGAGTDFALVRYNADGTLDTDFGIGGVVITDINGSDDSVRGLLQQSDGKLVAVGSADAGGDLDFVLARFNVNGSLDASFGSGGATVTDIGGSDDTARAVLQQPDGKIVAVGSAGSGASSDFALARYNADGSLDVAFGTGGVSTTDFDGWMDIAYDVVRQPDGKLVVAGTGTGDPSMARYAVDGTLDTSFGTDGKTTKRIASLPIGTPALIQTPGGQLLLAAGAGASGGSGTRVALIRYDADGVLDSGFGDNGVQMTDLGDGFTFLGADLVQQADGKVVVVGTTDIQWDALLVRYDSEGVIDTSFGTTGVVTSFLDSSGDQPYALLQQADRKLVVAGAKDPGGQGDFALARYNLDGSLDTSFGNDGTLTTNFVGDTFDAAHSLEQQQDGKLVVAGRGANNIGLARYGTDGSLDATFGSGGMATTDGGGAFAFALALVLQGDGTLVTAGGAYNGQDQDFTLARYTSDGDLDPSFGAGGTVTTDVDEKTDVAFGLVEQSGGKLVVAGLSGDVGDREILLIRYLPDGSVDSSFGSGGIVATGIGANGSLFPFGGLVQQQDGKLVVAGHVNTAGNEDFALARYDSNGSIDTTFGDDGLVTTAIGVLDDFSATLVQQSDGKLVVAGTSSTSSNDELVLVRYDPDGSLDTSFGSGGIAAIGVGGPSLYARALAQQSDGRLVVAGYSDGDFILARVLSSDCGNGILEAGEACDDGNFVTDDGCDLSCEVECGYDCSGEPSSCSYDGLCGDGPTDCSDQDTCDAFGACQPNHFAAGTSCADDGDPCTVNQCDGLGVCDDGDSDADGVGDLCDNCPAIFNSSQVDSDCSNGNAGCDDGGDACDICPADKNNQCDPQGSAGGQIDSDGGDLSSPDGSVEISVPPGAVGGDTTITATDGGPASGSTAFRLGNVMAVRLRPEGQRFDEPVTITFNWDDRDDDGRVDVGLCKGGADDGLTCDSNSDCASEDCTVTISNLDEERLVLRRNSARFGQNGFAPGYPCDEHQTGGGCEAAAANCADDPGSDRASVAECCDMASNTWTFQTCSFSEFSLGVDDFVEAEGIDTYVSYRVKASKQEDDSHKFPRDWNIQLHDTALSTTVPDNPENYLVRKELGLASPASTGAGTVPNDAALHYLRYQIKEAKEGVGEVPANGRFPKAAKAEKRLWEISNELGTVVVSSDKVTGLWVPAGGALDEPNPTAPDGRTHYLCYRVKALKGVAAGQSPGQCDRRAPANGRGACEDELDCGGTPGATEYCEKPKFAKDLQAFVADWYADCATFDDGVTVPFAGTDVEAKCLFDLRKPKELCNPVATSAVGPGRASEAAITDSTPTTVGSLLCYQPKLARKVTDETAATLAGQSVGAKLAAKQSKHTKRRQKDGNAVYTSPANGFPAPREVDTNKQELICLPSEVLSVVPMP